MTTNSKAADPGKFKDERKWLEWEKLFINYLLVIPGANGIPLSYVVREVNEPDDNADYPATFNERIIDGFLQSENTETWICSITKFQDGRRDMTGALQRHYAGEGDSTRRITDAKKIQNTLHYKSERSLPSNKFLDSLQRMFTIFEEEHEPLTERAKMDELLSKHKTQRWQRSWRN